MDCMAGTLTYLPLLIVVLTAMCAGRCEAIDADPAKLPKQNPNAIGYPSRDPNIDVSPGFVEPPAGYGEVPFYWWIGDPLTKERLGWQLEQLKGMGVSGLQINYCHTDRGGNAWGLSFPSDPPLFSDEWWKLVQWWSGECQKQGIAVSLSDYTLQGVGQGRWTDEILAENPDMHGSLLERDVREVDGGAKLEMQLPEKTVSVTAFRLVDGKIDPASSVDLQTDRRSLVWTAPEGKWRVYTNFSRVVPNSLDPINPKTGPKIIEKHFGRFEEHLPGQAGKGLNFFFSDELDFGIRGNLWSDRFAGEFERRKGYDIRPKLAALYDDIGPETPKIRMDYSDVMVSLEEESYFEPVFRWHYDRGMVYGCDHGGRGRDVTEFGDYFRTQRWMTGPGCDQPQLASDIVKNKVASSIAHLYQRPRTWLEGYHSSGWGTNSAQLTDATFKNFAMGQNLLSLHGLYYTTHGGFWEWAPPCNHFRMPYWGHMDVWFKCIRRLSYLMSQGVHRCDVAILYPVAPKEAGMDGDNAVGTAFGVGERLYNQGVDFDFIDFESLARAVCKDKELQVSGEAYKVLVLPAMKAVRWSTIEKAVEFKRAGGIVVAVGALPEASDRAGRDDAQLDKAVSELFGKSASCYDDLVKTISRSVERDFVPSNGCYVNHRKIGKRDVYMVVGAAKDSQCFFAATGKVELWDPWTGKMKPIGIVSQTDKGTNIKMPQEANEATLIVFTQGAKPVDVAPDNYVKSETINLDGQWDFEIKPTMDNRFGDFGLPASNTMIGAEIGRFTYSDGTGAEAEVLCGFGEKFWRLGPLPKGADTSDFENQLAGLKSVTRSYGVELGSSKYVWQPLVYSLEQGVQGDPGHEGYHGLKEEISDDFIALGRRNFTSTGSSYSSESDGAGRYYLWTSVVSEKDVRAKIVVGGMTPSGAWLGGKKIDDLTSPVRVPKGSTPLLLRYEGAGRGHFLLQVGDERPSPKYPLAMSWYCKPGLLAFDPMPEVEKPTGTYSFRPPPGTKSMKVVVHGSLVGARLKDDAINFARKGQHRDGSWDCVLTLPRVTAVDDLISLIVQQERGYHGGAAISEPISCQCGIGRIPTGDWCQFGLRSYSGGAWYRKSITLKEVPAYPSGRVMLRLGDVVSSAEVRVNGEPAGVRLASPWDFDISGMVRPGENKIEILVYNSLANYYTTIPTRYGGDTKSGLIGPVSIEIAKRAAP